jgi:hypothetical protein
MRQLDSTIQQAMIWSTNVTRRPPVRAISKDVNRADGSIGPRRYLDDGKPNQGHAASLYLGMMS